VTGYEQAARASLERGRAASIEQRLDWLDEMLGLARESGALAREVNRRRRERGLPPLAEVRSAAGDPQPPR
jgi:hypothetical protein